MILRHLLQLRCATYSCTVYPILLTNIFMAKQKMAVAPNCLNFLSLYAHDHDCGHLVNEHEHDHDCGHEHDHGHVLHGCFPQFNR